MKTTVIYHGDADGFGAAYAVSRREDIEVIAYIPVQYGRGVPELPKETEALFILDFSFSPSICDNIIETYDLKELLILDHHESAEEMLKGYPYAFFNMNKSGAVMAWEFFHYGKPVPDILKYVQDRDLWKFELEYSEEVNLYIASLPRTFDDWDQWALDTAISAGRSIKRFRDNQIEQSLKNVRFGLIGGYRVPMVNCTANISEVGDALCKKFPDAPFSVSYYDRAPDFRSYSLRTIGDCNVAQLAKCYGGGGHKKAAGFTLKKELAESLFE